LVRIRKREISGLVCRPANTALVCCYFRLFRAFPMQEAVTAPQTSTELLAVGPDVAKVFAVVALSTASLSPIWFYLDDNVVKAIQLEYLVRFYVSC
jgi:hypothetical protein